MSFINKYLKYKNKYLNMKKQIGGGKCRLCRCRYSSPGSAAGGTGCECLKYFEHKHVDESPDSARPPLFGLPGFAGSPVLTRPSPPLTRPSPGFAGPPSLHVFVQNIGINKSDIDLRHASTEEITEEINAHYAKHYAKHRDWFVANHTVRLFSGMFTKLKEKFGIDVDFAVFQEIYSTGILDMPLGNSDTKSLVAMHSHKSKKPDDEFFLDGFYKCTATLQNRKSTLEINAEETMNFFNRAILDDAAFKRRKQKIETTEKGTTDIVEAVNIDTHASFMEGFANVVKSQTGRLVLNESYMKGSAINELSKHMMISVYGNWLMINIHLDPKANIRSVLSDLWRYIEHNHLSGHKIIISGDFNHVSEEDEAHDIKVKKNPTRLSVRNKMFQDFLTNGRMSLHTDRRMGFIISDNVDFTFKHIVEPFATDCISKRQGFRPSTSEHFGYIYEFFEVPDGGNGHLKQHHFIDLSVLETRLSDPSPFWSQAIHGYKTYDTCVPMYNPEPNESPFKKLLVDTFFRGWWDKLSIEEKANIERFMKQTNIVHADRLDREELVKRDCIAKFKITESQYQYVLHYLSGAAPASSSASSAASPRASSATSSATSSAATTASHASPPASPRASSAASSATPVSATTASPATAASPASATPLATTATPASATPPVRGWWVNSNGRVSSSLKNTDDTKLDKTNVSSYYVRPSTKLLTKDPDNTKWLRLSDGTKWWVTTKGELYVYRLKPVEEGLEILDVNDLDRTSLKYVSPFDASREHPFSASRRDVSREPPFDASRRGVSRDFRNASQGHSSDDLWRRPGFSEKPYVVFDKKRTVPPSSCSNGTKYCKVVGPHTLGQCR